MLSILKEWEISSDPYRLAIFLRKHISLQDAYRASVVAGSVHQLLMKDSLHKKDSYGGGDVVTVRQRALDGEGHLQRQQRGMSMTKERIIMLDIYNSCILCGFCK